MMTEMQSFIFKTSIEASNVFFFKAFGAAKDSNKTDLKKVNLPFKAAHNDSTRG